VQRVHCRLRVRPRRRFFLRLRQRQPQMKRRAFARHAVHRHRAAVGVHQLPDQVQAEAQPAEVRRGSGPLETGEDPLVVRGRDPDPRVADGDTRPAIVAPFRYCAEPCVAR